MVRKIFAVLALLVHQTIAGETCFRSNCKKEGSSDSLTINHASFTQVPDQKIDPAWPINETLQVSGTQEERIRACTERCVKIGIHGCRTGNLSPYQENAPSTCDLFTFDIYAHSLRIVSTGWASFHLFNSFCEGYPCQNEGICNPNFHTDEGYCKCTGYSGTLCQTLDPLHHEEAGHWTFDDYTLSNTGLGANTLATSESGDGIVLETLERDSPVLQCQTTNCLIIDNTNMPCLKEYESPYCPSGFTFAFWLRPLKAQPPHIFINQGGGSSAGIAVQSRYIASSGEMRLDIVLKLKSTMYKVYLDLATTSKSDGRIWKEWTFVGITYDPTTSKCYYILDDQIFEMPNVPNTSTQPRPFKFNSELDRVFLLDDIIYIPAFSNQEAVYVIYNQTK